MSQDKIINEFKAIHKSTDSAESKPNRYRIVLEKACKFLIDVPLDEKMGMPKILNTLANSPGTFNLQITSRVSKLNNYFSTWSHANDLIFDIELFHEHVNLFKEFLETVFDEKIRISEEPENPSNAYYLVTRTRFFVNQHIFDDLKSTSKGLHLKVRPNNGRHPKGDYFIPHNIIIQFIKEKQDAYNWDKNKNFHQDGIPGSLKSYFVPIN